MDDQLAIRVSFKPDVRVHTIKAVKARRGFWEGRGLYLFYLPPYSPELNIIEILWRELKCRWLRPEDYACLGGLFYQVTLALMAVGGLLKVNFSKFNFSKFNLG